MQVQDGVQGLASTSTAPKEHLVVMVHGLFGTRDNWKARHACVAAEPRLPPPARLAARDPRPPAACGGALPSFLLWLLPWAETGAGSS